MGGHVFYCFNSLRKDNQTWGPFSKNSDAADWEQTVLIFVGGPSCVSVLARLPGHRWCRRKNWGPGLGSWVVTEETSNWSGLYVMCGYVTRRR